MFKMIFRKENINAENAVNANNLSIGSKETEIIYQLDLLPIKGELAKLLKLNDETKNYFAAMSEIAE